MIYLNKDHNIKDKYEDSDWIKTPLVIFLNNTYDLLIKKEVMKEYGFEEIEKEVKKMCNLGEMIARENIEKGHSMCGTAPGDGRPADRSQAGSLPWQRYYLAGRDQRV